MKIKVEYVILVVIIGLLLLYLGVHKTDKTHYQLPVLPPVKVDDLSKITIVHGDTHLTLLKSGDRWDVSPQGYPATTNRVQDMLNIIKDLTLTAMVSESKQYERYDLQPAARIHVQAWSGDQLKRDFEIGKTASSFRHTFVKIAGDDRVYHARENFRSKFDQTAESMHDKQVLSFEADTIQAIRLVRGDVVTRLVRSQEQAPTTADTQAQPAPPESTPQPSWQTAAGEPLDSGKIKNLLNTMARLNCEKYIYDRSKQDLQNPIFTVVLEGQQEYTLALFARREKDSGPYPATSSENAYPFLLPEHRVKNIMIPVDDLKVGTNAS